MYLYLSLGSDFMKRKFLLLTTVVMLLFGCDQEKNKTEKVIEEENKKVEVTVLEENKKPVVRVEKEEKEEVEIKEDGVLLEIYPTEKFFDHNTESIILETENTYALETVRMTSPMDGVNVSLESGEYLFMMGFFSPMYDEFSVELEKDKVYEFKVTIPEGIPYNRIVAELGEYRNEWIISYNGMEEVEKIQLEKKKWSPKSLEEYAPEMALVKASVLSTYLEETEEFYEEDYNYWRNIALATTYLDPRGTLLEGEFEDALYIDEWLLPEIIKSLYPNYKKEVEKIPDLVVENPGGIGFYSAITTYEPEITPMIDGVEEIDGNAWAVYVRVIDTKEDIVKDYEVILKENSNFNELSPFDYSIDSIKEITQLDLKDN